MSKDHQVNQGLMDKTVKTERQDQQVQQAHEDQWAQVVKLGQQVRMVDPAVLERQENKAHQVQ